MLYIDYIFIKKNCYSPSTSSILYWGSRVRCGITRSVFEDFFLLMWTIFKVFIEFVTILFLFLWFGFLGHEACEILAPRPGIEPAPPALEGEVLITTGPPGKSPRSVFLKMSDIEQTEEPGRLQSMGLLRVGHDWVSSLFTFMHWRRKWQPTPVLLPGESQGWGSLVRCRLWGRTELDTTEVT